MSVDIDEKLFREFKAKAASNGKKMKEIVIEWVKEYVNKK